VTGGTGGFDGLAGAGRLAAPAVPAGIRTVGPASTTATRVVLIRHGEAVCNVSGVCGGRLGCTGLTDRGRAQVATLRDRLLLTGELAGTDVLYASVLPRAIETAELVAPALAGRDAEGRMGPPLVPRTECGLCELHPGHADGQTWEQFSERFGALDWDTDPDQPIAPHGESWTGFVNRVAATLDAIVEQHPGQLVVVACHAGVIEASLLAKVPVAGGREGARLQLRTQHASMTGWEIEAGRWRLSGYNDAAHQAVLGLAAERSGVTAGQQA
jgi:2,3-bisphosphoglycerate-dependent phosphoglycerate mutase